MITVLHIIPSMDPSSGGPCQGIRNLVPDLIRHGANPEVLCLDDPLEKFLSEDEFRVTAIGPSKSPWRYSAKLVPWLVENLARFDVVIIHAIWLYHGYGFRKALRQYKKLQADSGRAFKIPKFYVMPHGMLDPYFQRAPERKLKAIRNWFYWKFIESKLISEADGILFTCQEELLLAKKSFRPYHPRQEINIGYGVVAPPGYEQTMQDVLYNTCPEITGRPFVLFLSRIHEKKGISHLIEAYSRLMTAGKKKLFGQFNPSSLPKLLIAGPGLDSVYGKKMQSLVVTKNLTDHIFFPGMLTGNAKWGAFYGCDAFILPSHQENFGIAVVEALACGKPVLISNQINIWREIIEAGGGMVEDNTAAGTEKLLEKWLQLTEEAKIEMGQRAQESFRKSFSIDTSSKRFFEMLIS